MECDHFWRTIEVQGYGWVSECEKCGHRESAEHTDECLRQRVMADLPCECGAEAGFQKFVAGERESL